MDPCIVAGVRGKYPTHSTVQMIRADHQRKILQDMLIAAQRPKDDLNSVQRAAQKAEGLSQAYGTRAEARGAAAFPSQAEMTLTKYSSTGGSCGGGHNINCFGCGGPHPWSEYIEGKHVLKCPNKLNPGVADNATKAIERYRANRKKQKTKDK